MPLGQSRVKTALAGKFSGPSSIQVSSTGGAGRQAAKAAARQQEELLAKLAAQQQSQNKSAKKQFQGVTGAQKKASKRARKAQKASIKEIGKVGKQAEKDIEAQRQRSQATALQSVMNRGLGNTTVLDSVRRGIDTDASTARAGLAERIAGLRSGALQQSAGLEANLGGFAVDTLLSRETVRPDVSQTLQLLQRLGGG